MILVDTSVWVDHLRRNNTRLAERLHAGAVACHPFIIGELACGNLGNREEILSLLQALPTVPISEPDEILAFIEGRSLMGKGLGYVDMHLLASTFLAGILLWTTDRRLRQVSRELGVVYERH